MSVKNSNVIIYEDENLLVLNKTAGWLTIPDRYEPELPNVRDMLQSRYPEIFVVHRLDKETSGALCFAKQAQVHKVLSKQFESRQVSKKYHALCEGVMLTANGTIDLPLALNPKRGIMEINRQSGKRSVTHYRVLECFKAHTLVEIDLETGRQHQIRAHFRAVGFPLVGDTLYGKGKPLLLSAMKRRFNLNRSGEEQPLMERTCLHSLQLGFQHPLTDETLQIEAPLAKDFEVTLKMLRRFAPARVV